MTIIESAKSELGDLVRDNITNYTPNDNAEHNTVRKNFRRAMLGVGAYFLVKHLGPDSNALFATMTYVAEKSALVYSVVRAYQTVRDFFDYM
ncbi:hypothetical protein ACFLZ6_01640 [Nanoarchaeota archaeon]